MSNLPRMPRPFRSAPRTRSARAARFAALAALLLTAGCQSITDAVAPGRDGAPPARLALDVQLPRLQTSAFEVVELVAVPEYDVGEVYRALGEPIRRPLAPSGDEDVALSLELGPCLDDADAVRPAGDGSCRVRVALTLRGDGADLDTQLAGPFTLTPGGSVTAPAPIQLFEVDDIAIAVVGEEPPPGAPLPIDQGATASLQATVRDAAGRPVAGKPVQWSSSNPAIASVNAQGVVTGVTPGPATITATSGGRSATLAVQVVPPFVSVTVTGPAEILRGTLDVVSSPAGIACTITSESETGTCTSSFEIGTALSLSAIAADGSVFEFWSGNDADRCADAGATVCDLTVPDAPVLLVARSDVLRLIEIRPASGNVSLSGLDAEGTVTDVNGLLDEGCSILGPEFGGVCGIEIGSRQSLALLAQASEPSANAEFLSDACDVIAPGSGSASAVCTINPPFGASELVEVRFDGPETLTVTAEGNAAGVVSSDGFTDLLCAWDGSLTSGTCDGIYRPGEDITLLAAPGQDGRFLGWRIDGAPSLVPGVELALSVDGPREVVAVFAASASQVTIEAPTGLLAGTVTVTSDPAGISCVLVGDGTSGSCAADFDVGSTVSLSAAADPGTIFEQWIANGLCTPDNQAECSLTVPGEDATIVVLSDVLRTISVRPSSSNLSLSELPGEGFVDLDVQGLGSVRCDMSGLAFSGTCDVDVPSRRTLNLAAASLAPSSDVEFLDFGNVCDSKTPGNDAQPALCTVLPPFAGGSTIDVFIRGPEQLIVAGSGGGTGTITATGISCTWDTESSSGQCDGVYRAGSQVLVTATPDPESDFVGWRLDGSLSITDLNPTITLDLNGPREAVAVFDLGLEPLTIDILPGSGAGTILVDGSPACTVAAPLEGTTCILDVPRGTVVELTATPGLGSIHERWGNACTGTIPEIEVFNVNLPRCGGPMDEPITVSAVFAARVEIPFFMVDSDPINRATGGFTIASPGRLTFACDKDTSSDFVNCGTVGMPVGASVTFQVTPSDIFVGWSGDVPSACIDSFDLNPCTFTIGSGGLSGIDAIVFPPPPPIVAPGTPAGARAAPVRRSVTVRPELPSAPLRPVVPTAGTNVVRDGRRGPPGWPAGR